MAGSKARNEDKEPGRKNGNGKRLDVAAQEFWLWEAACQIRGPRDAPKFKDYILPLILLKRLSDVFDDEVSYLAKEFGNQKTTAELVDQDHKLVRFYVPQKARWTTVAQKTTGLEEHLTDAARAIQTLLDGQPVLSHHLVLRGVTEITNLGPGAFASYFLAVAMDTNPGISVSLSWEDDSGKPGQRSSQLNRF